MIQTAFRDRSPTPWHLWVVGALALAWSTVWALDYVVTQLQMEPYFQQFSRAQRAMFYDYPAWAVAAWGCTVWGSLLGSLMLLLRRGWAHPLIGLSVIGLFVSEFHDLLLSSGPDILGGTGVAFTAVIWVVTLGLYYYARRMVKRRAIV